MEDMLQNPSMESLKQLKVVGISQFNKECEQTQNLPKKRQVCLMSKLYTNPETGERYNVGDMDGKDEVTIAEHCSARLLF